MHGACEDPLVSVSVGNQSFPSVTGPNPTQPNSNFFFLLLEAATCTHRQRPLLRRSNPANLGLRKKEQLFLVLGGWNFRTRRERSVAMPMIWTPSSPTRRDRVPEDGEEYYIDDFPGLETWEDPIPRPSRFTFEELRDAFVAGSMEQLRLRPKSPSREERTRRRQEHDRNSLLIALNAYAKEKNMQPSELEFVEVKERNLVDEYGTGYVHFNFLVKGSDGTPTLFFAEVHPDCRGEEDVYLCTPLEETDCGHCFGCNDQAKDLIHPTGGGYLGGHIDVGFPSVELDSDDDCFI